MVIEKEIEQVDEAPLKDEGRAMTIEQKMSSLYYQTGVETFSQIMQGIVIGTATHEIISIDNLLHNLYQFAYTTDLTEKQLYSIQNGLTNSMEILVIGMVISEGITFICNYLHHYRGKEVDTIQISNLIKETIINFPTSKLPEGKFSWYNGIGALGKYMFNSNLKFGQWYNLKTEQFSNWARSWFLEV